MKNIEVFFWEIGNKYNKELLVNIKDPKHIFNELDQEGRYITFREMITLMFGTDDIITISKDNEGVFLSYKDYNNFEWAPNYLSSKSGGLSQEILKTKDFPITKVKPGLLFIKNINWGNTILNNYNDFRKILFNMPPLLAEICYNIYHYEYINIPENININDFYYEQKEILKNMDITNGDIISEFREGQLSNINPKYLKVMPKLKSMGFYW